MDTASVGTTDVIAPVAEPPLRRSIPWDVVVAVASFGALCVAVLLATPLLVEPDDFAYKGTILAITHGYLLELTKAEMTKIAPLAMTVHVGGNVIGLGPGGWHIAQWVHLSNGRWISEKDPGYPFLAAPFQWLGIIRLAPLFYGALGCVGLFVGGRRWLGPVGGAAAVGLYCSSGAALLFAWRDYMPTFTDASLIAAGTGLLLWTLLATEASSRRRTFVGLLAFVALELAVFVRYTNIVELGCAVLVVLAVSTAARTRLPARMLLWWLASVAVFAGGLLLFNDLVYGGPLRSGYQPGEIRFSTSAISPNLRYMPGRLLDTMPMSLLALAALILAVGMWGWSRRRSGSSEERGAAQRDFAIAGALGLSWVAIWGLYAAYDWTAAAGLTNLQAVRFYLPGIGAISLLGAFLLARLTERLLRRRELLRIGVTALVVAGLLALGVRSYGEMRLHGMPSFRGGPGPGPAGRIAPGD